MESLKVVTLKPIEATPSSFKDYGQVIEPSPDDQRFGPHDAQLDLTQGIPSTLSGLYYLDIKCTKLGSFW
ncbi:putative ureidoglycolate hydrolase [Trifolium pratense]|uniref:Putative ureidoglycolate hydrolase n=2 Tax=Trifolium pratense TaxID=57577 RepID=A0A2K3JWG1_TRIPR|nr:putative ureidoglycolate hydrolase [Trifolium pratense]